MSNIRDIRVVTGGMDNDSVIENILQGDYEYAVNIITSTIDGQNMGSIRNRKGTTLCDFNLPSGVCKCICTAEDKKNNQLIYLIYNGDYNHLILKYDVQTNTIYYVLRQQDFSYQLAFEFENPRSAEIINGYLFWQSPVNIHMMSIEKAVNFTKNIFGTYSISDGEKYDIINEETLSLIKYAPTPPIYSYGTSDTGTNFVKGNLFQFAALYGYELNQESVYSQFTEQPIPLNEIAANGTWIEDDINANNCIDISVYVGSSIRHLVKYVKIIARCGNNSADVITGKGKWFLIDTIHSENFVSNSAKTRFLNNRVREFIPDIALNNFDNVPILSDEIGVVLGEHLVVGGLTEGFDNVPVICDFNIVKELNELVVNTVILQPIIRLCPYWREEILGYLYLNDPGELSNRSVFTTYYAIYAESQIIPARNTVYTITLTRDDSTTITALYSTANILLNDPLPSANTILSYLYNQLRISDQTNILYNTFDLPNAGVDYNISNYYDNDAPVLPHNLVVRFFKYRHFIPFVGSTIDDEYEFNYTHSPKGENQQFLGRFAIDKSNSLSLPTWHEGEDVIIGIEYFDKYMRSGGVIEIKTVKVPRTLYYNFNSINKNTINWTITSPPPSWAYYYQFVVLKDSGIDKFVQFECPVTTPLSIGYTVDQNVFFDVNTGIREYNKLFKKSIIPEWVFQKGDRIRLKSIWNGLNDYTVPSWSPRLFDKEIIGIQNLPVASLIANSVANAGTINTEISPQSGDSANTAASTMAGVENSFGKFIVENFDITTFINGLRCVVEIYRPKRIIENKLYYGFGQFYRIENAGTDLAFHMGNISSAFNNTSGYFTVGNCFIKNRITGSSDAFCCEERNYSDFYISDSGHYGRSTAVIDNMKRDYYPTKLKNSDKFLESSNTCFINKFTADPKVLPYKYGAIKGLKELGWTLKVVSDNKVSSVDISREQLITGDGTSIVTYSSKVLGSERPTVAEFGSKHHKGVVVSFRYMYFFDIKNGVLIRDAANGQEEISKYKMASYFKNMAYQLQLHDNSEVISGYNNIYEEVVFSFYGDINMVANGNSSSSLLIGTFTDGVIIKSGEEVELLGYSENRLVSARMEMIIVNGNMITIPYNAINGGFTYKIRRSLGTIVFSELTNRWTTFLTAYPEIFSGTGQTFIGFKNGTLNLHDTNSVRNEIYGFQFTSKIGMIFNIQPLRDRVYNCMSYIADSVWSVSSIIIPIRNMISRIKGAKFKKKATTYYADFNRDINSPGGITSGRPLQGRIMKVELENESQDEAYLYEVEVNSNLDKRN